MTGKHGRGLIGQIKDHGFLYLIVLICFFAGIFGGSYAVRSMTKAQTLDLLNYLNLFLQGISEWSVSPAAAAQYSILNNVKVILYIWVLGLTVIGIPLVLLLVAARGFVLGFTVGFLVQQKAGQGIVIALVTIFPSSLISIPALIVGASLAITFSGWLVRGRQKYENSSLARQLAAYCIIMLLVALAAALAGVVEAYVSPALLKLLARLSV